MSSWVLKAAAQRFIGVLPDPHYWNELFQRRVTRSYGLTAESLADKLGRCRTHLEHLRAFRPRNSGDFTVFELGTGWYPAAPIGFFLCGAREVWTWDIVPHLKLEGVRSLLNQLIQLDLAGELRQHLPGLLPERLGNLRAVAIDRSALHPNELLERLSIHYRIGDAAHSGLGSGSLDLITSAAVLEYISSEALTRIFAEFRRIAAPDAVMSHWIAVDDQYALHDPSITSYNFLRFSDRSWRWINNPIIPQKRLRITDYRRMLRDAGFGISDETVTLYGNPTDLAKVPLASRFRVYSHDDLLVLRAWLAAVPERSTAH